MRISGSSEESSEEGFSFLSKLLLLATALLSTDICNVSINAVGESSVGRALLTLFSRPDIDVVSPYHTSRNNIAEILALLVEVGPTYVDMTHVLSKLSTQYFNTQTSDKDATQAEIAKTQLKHAVLCCQHTMDRMYGVTSGYRIANSVPILFEVLLDGCSHPEIEVSKACHATMILVCSGLQVSCSAITWTYYILLAMFLTNPPF